MEIGVVVIGPLVNVGCFLILALLAKAFYKFANMFPEACSKFVASFGVATVLDPILVIIVDLAMHNYSCASYSASCLADYTSNECACYIGDFQKLWVRLLASEGSGIAGAIITICLYLGSTVVDIKPIYSLNALLHV